MTQLPSWNRRALWRALPAALVVIAAIAPPGCKPKSSAGPTALAPIIRMGDPRAATQLLKGFYGIEAGEWRWTARQFNVLLRAPAGAGQNGATVDFRLTATGPVIAKLGQITLTGSVGGKTLHTETYSSPGDQAFVFDVPPAMLGNESVEIDFELDRVMPPNPPEMRELGVVAHSIVLRSK